MKLNYHLVNKLLELEDLNLFLVGGVVRDLLLNRPVLDVDLVICEEKENLKKNLERILEVCGGLVNSEISIHVQDRVLDFRTFKIEVVSIEDSFSLDFVFARKESYSSLAAKPEVSKGTLLDDLFRRDFSINALATKSLTLKDPVIDNFDGINDINNKKIKILHDRSFYDDPIRILRGIRFKQRLGFCFENKTEELLTYALEKNWIEAVGLGRRYAEFIKIFEEPNPINVLIELSKYEIVGVLLGISGFSHSKFLENVVRLKPKEKEEILKCLVEVLAPSEKEFFIKTLPIKKDLKVKLKGK